MKRKYSLILVIAISCITLGCGNSARNKLKDCLKISGGRFEGVSKSGNVYGDAIIQVSEDGTSCQVEYSLLGSTAIEDGKITNLELEEDTSNNTYKIIGDWEVNGSSQGARFYFEVFGKELPNTVFCKVGGTNVSWSHYSNLTLPKDKFLKIKKILSINSNESIVLKEEKKSMTPQKEVKEIQPSKSEVNKLVAKYKNFEYIENSFFTFIDDKGTEYTFTDIPETYNLISEDGPNKLFINKIFKIDWITVSGEYDYPINKITNIELIK
jgi:hypothetical protein